MRCGESWRRDEIEREYAPPTSSMARGTAVHAVAAEAHTRQIAGKVQHPDWPKSVVLRESLPGEDEAADLAATRFEHERRTSGIVADADEVEEEPKVLIGRAKDSAVRMSRHIVTRIAPYVDPLAVEQKLVIEPRDSDVRISGILDLITVEPPVDGVTPRRGIRDYKTSKRAPDADEADTSGQLSMYALLDSMANEGAIADVFALDYIVEDPRRFSGAPYMVSLESERKQEDIDVTVERLNNAIEGVKAGVFLANGVGTWVCSPKWCRWHSSCRFVSKARRKP